MTHDDPKKPEFASWRSFAEYAHRVMHSRRFVWDEAIQAFMNTVIATIRERETKIPKGSVLFRAQRGTNLIPNVDDNGVEIGMDVAGFGPERMKPLPNRAIEGRANPTGICVLYLASLEQTAISEVRPWIGSDVSVAQFQILRDVRAINLAKGHGEISIGQLMFSEIFGDTAPTAEKKERAVWIDIDNAFSRPITLSDDAADYVPTQILAELFRDAGFEALIYRSQFGENGYNVALFSPTDAEPINCAPYEVTRIDVKYREIGTRWFSSKRSLQEEK